jgi:hypothetical protein
MTGCDLRYEAEQMGARVSTRFQEGQDGVTANAITLGEALDTLEPLATVVAGSLVAVAIDKVRQARNDLNRLADDIWQRSADTRRDVNDTIEKVRSHFHEAVDQRAQEEGCDCDEERSEGYSEGRSEGTEEGKREMWETVRDAVTRALNDCEE